VFSVTMTTWQRYPWFGLHPELSTLGVGELQRLSSEDQVKLFAWCFMPDHVHVLIQCPDLMSWVRRFKGRLAHRAALLEPKRRLWQRSFYDHALRKEEDLEKAAIYIWGNPARAGLVPHAGEYQWSGSGVWEDWKSRMLP